MRLRKRKAEVQPDEDQVEDVQHAVHAGMEGGHKPNGKDAKARIDTDDPVTHFKIPFNEKEIICERRGGQSPGKQPKLIFTHGAGGGLTAPATKDFADGFADAADVVSFQGTMNLKSRVKAFHTVIEHEGVKSETALGGRSMGARAAVIEAIEGEQKTKALVLVSFPLVGGKKGDSREQILLDLPAGVDVLFISGDRDSMCNLAHLADVQAQMEARSWTVIVEGADHGMSWKWKDGVEAMRRKTGALAAEWLGDRDVSKQSRSLSWDEESGEVRCNDWANAGETSCLLYTSPSPRD